MVTRAALGFAICITLAAASGGLRSSHAQTAPQTPTPSTDTELARGEHIARFVCSVCHVVARDQESAPVLSHPGPSFYDIANRPGVSAESLAHFISNTHWDPDKAGMTMPAVMPSAEQARAVTRYILSLKKPPAKGAAP